MPCRRLSVVQLLRRNSYRNTSFDGVSDQRFLSVPLRNMLSEMRSVISSIFMVGNACFVCALSGTHQIFVENFKQVSAGEAEGRRVLLRPQGLGGVLGRWRIRLQGLYLCYQWRLQLREGRCHLSFYRDMKDTEKEKSVGSRKLFCSQLRG